MQIEKAAVDGERQKLEADLGPVRYLATLLGSTDEATMRYFMLVVALLLDPAAVLLLPGDHRACHAMKHRRAILWQRRQEAPFQSLSGKGRIRPHRNLPG